MSDGENDPALELCRRAGVAYDYIDFASRLAKLTVRELMKRAAAQLRLMAGSGRVNELLTAATLDVIAEKMAGAESGVSRASDPFPLPTGPEARSDGGAPEMTKGGGRGRPPAVRTGDEIDLGLPGFPRQWCRVKVTAVGEVGISYEAGGLRGEITFAEEGDGGWRRVPGEHSHCACTGFSYGFADECECGHAGILHLTGGVQMCIKSANACPEHATPPKGPRCGGCHEVWPCGCPVGDRILKAIEAATSPPPAKVVFKPLGWHYRDPLKPATNGTYENTMCGRTVDYQKAVGAPGDADCPDCMAEFVKRGGTNP